MGTPSKKHIVKVLLHKHGRLFSKEIGISLQKGTPAALFQWLTASLLFSARIRSSIAVEAAKSLNKQGWRTARRMTQSTWEQRVHALHDAGYARYQEKTASMLEETANLLSDRYGGDIRKLRKAAKHHPDQERHLLKECKGIGNIGVDIFFREIQGIWKELFPFADQQALQSAKKLKLGNTSKALAKLTTPKNFPLFIAALIRIARDSLHKEVLAEATRSKT